MTQKEGEDNMKMNLIEASNYFSKFNKMKFDKDKALKIADILVRLGCTSTKHYNHLEKEIPMFDWRQGCGTLFYEDDEFIGKFELGYDRNGKGWFCPDLERKF